MKKPTPTQKPAFKPADDRSDYLSSDPRQVVWHGKPQPAPTAPATKKKDDRHDQADR